MSSTTQHPICATCNLHKCSPFSGCLGTTVGDKQEYCTCPRSTACPTCTLDRCPSPFGICDGQEICTKHCTGHIEKVHSGANPFGFPYEEYARFRTEEDAANAARRAAEVAEQKYTPFGDPRTSSSPFEVPSVEYLLAENAKMKSALERAVYELNNLEHRNDVLERKNKNLKKAMSLLLSNDDE